MVKVSNGRWDITLDRELDRVQVTNRVKNRGFECSVNEADQLARCIDAANSVPDGNPEEG